jgi:hypothetical protein
VSAAVAVSREEHALVEAMRQIRKGWTQGAYCRTKNGAACMPDGSEGDIRRCDLAWAVDTGARAHGLEPDELRRLVQAQLPPAFRTDDLGLERWNDALWRTRTEVILVLERTISGLL